MKQFNSLVEALQSLPSIGAKSATRLAYHMVMNDTFNALKLSHAIQNALSSLRKCDMCGGMSEHELCDICIDENRDKTKLALVQNAKDILTFEENGIFDGRYFVLEEIDTDTIIDLQRVVSSNVKEIIFAFSPSIANDAIILYIEDKLSAYDINFTRIAQGVPTGVSLENIDIISLTRALDDRVKI